MAKIVIDGACWINRRGYGRYMRETLGALWKLDRSNEYVVIADHEIAEASAFPDHVRVRLVEIGESPARGAVAGGRRTIRDLWKIGAAARAESCDIFFFSSVYSYFPYFGGGKVAVVFHDCIAERHPRMIFPNRRSEGFWRLKTKLARMEASQIITVSEFSRSELAEVFGLDPARIRVVSEAAAPLFARARGNALGAGARARLNLPLEGAYFLYVGGFAPHKNLPRLIRAFVRIASLPEGANVSLVLAGDPGGDGFFSNKDEVSDLIRTHKLEDRVRIPGYIPEDDLAPLYSGALALVLPSLCEGFGLPAVEAAAAGTPVIATLKSPLPQVLEGGGIFVNPESEDELAEALGKMISHPLERTKMAETAARRADALSWDASARSLKECFDLMLAKG
ncbi:glycosyltransferase family 4 protein [Candidatus Sumerlaeota bacterium]|nr:glycosyltransferase family 4 protein [Candidatus Sumerlaeota bacterium]